MKKLSNTWNYHIYTTDWSVIENATPSLHSLGMCLQSDLSLSKHGGQLNFSYFKLVS